MCSAAHTRAGARAVDLGAQSVYQEGQSLKLSTKAAVFKRVGLLIKMSGHSWPPLAPAMAHTECES